MNLQELLAEVETAPVVKRAITNHSTLNEAYDYGSAFSRGMRIDLNGVSILLISGTASIDEHGRTVHVGDFRAQLQRTFENIGKLLAAEGATWHDIVRTTCYLRDIDRDYEAFNEERTAFFKAQGLIPLPASTGIEAKLCRPDVFHMSVGTLLINVAWTSFSPSGTGVDFDTSRSRFASQSSIASCGARRRQIVADATTAPLNTAR